MDWLTQQSVIQYIGFSSRKSAENCGYCRNPDAPETTPDGSEDDGTSGDGKRSVCFGLWGFRVTPAEYQMFCDYGWRRSGRYFYKPEMEKTCCPLYTIRLDAAHFALSRSQKRVLRIWRDFLQFDKKSEVKPQPNKAESAAYAGPRSPKFPTPQRTEPRPNAGQKRKIMRKERAIKRMTEKGIDVKEFQRQREERERARQRRIEDYIVNYEEGFKHKLELRIVSAGTEEFADSFEESFLVYKKYQNIIHKDMDCTKKGFQSFLVDNPFVPRDFEPLFPGGPSEGAHHLQYLIDGKIVAVGVIDILPNCLSSAYFYYDPDYQFLNFGTYSALREIELVRRIMKHKPNFRFYYMGYYVHNCRKMRYKAAFRPSELLCDKTHHWVPLPECLKKLNANNGEFAPFVEDAPPAPEGSVYDCQPIKYTSEEFEKVPVDEVIAHKLAPVAKYIGPNCSKFYIII
uniref:Arginyl-tRNA--protein transferase 1 n=1 Tax=Bursaphelenchus xylophilus TaxID=6326 RepID=A0A1I7RVM2_BURXY